MRSASFQGPTSRTRRPIHIETLGGPRFLLRGKEVELGPKAASLLAVVASHGETALCREELAELLWSKGSIQVLQKRMGHLRRALSERFGGIEPLVWNGRTVHLNSSTASSDLDLLADLLRADQLTTAATLVSAGFLPSLKAVANANLTSWLIRKDDELKHDVLQLAARMRSAAIGRADWNEVAETASALLVVDPHDEDLLLRLMRDLARLGRPEDADAAYQAFLKRRTEVDPSWQPRNETLETLAQLSRLAQIASQERLAVRSPSEDLAPFVGRAGELNELRILLAERPSPGPQFVCVSGEAGSGRSRLVREALRSNSPSSQPLFTFSRKPSDRLADTEYKPDWNVDLQWLTVTRHASPGEPARRLIALFERLSFILMSPNRLSLSFDAVYSDLLSAIRASPNLILVIDDFELAPFWIQNIPHLIQTHLFATPVTLVLVTYDDFDPTALCHSRVRFPVLQISVPKLDEEAILEIARAHTRGTGREMETAGLLRLASGRPGIALTLVQQDGGFSDDFPYNSLDQIPTPIRSTLLKHLGTVSTTPLRILEMSACADGVVQLKMIQELLNISELELEASLNELEGKKLVEVRPEEVRLVDPMLAALLRARVPSARQIRISREVVRGLQGNGSILMEPRRELQGPHFLRLARHHFILGDLEHAKAGALAAARSSLEMSEYDSCLGLLKALVEKERELDPSVSLGIASILERLGRAERAIFHYREAERKLRLRGEVKRSLQSGVIATHLSLRLRETSSSEAQDFLENAVSISLRRGWLDVAANALGSQLRLADAEFRFCAAERVLEQADSLSRSESPVGTAKVKVDILRSLGAMFGKGHEFIPIGWDAIDVARRLGDPELQSEAINSLMASLLYFGQLETSEGERLLTYLADSGSSESPDPSLGLLSRMNKAVWAIDTWDYQLAIDLLGKELERTSRVEDDRLALVRLNYAIALYQVRRIPEAEKELEEASKGLGPRPSSAAQVAQLALSGLLALERGSFEGAGEHQKNLQDLQVPGPFDPTLALELQARWYWYHGQRGSAFGVLKSAIALMRSSTPLYRASAWELLAGLYERDASQMKAQNARREAMNIAESLNVAHLTWRLLGKLKNPTT